MSNSGSAVYAVIIGVLIVIAWNKHSDRMEALERRAEYADVNARRALADAERANSRLDDRGL